MMLLAEASVRPKALSPDFQSVFQGKLHMLENAPPNFETRPMHLVN